MSHYDVTNAAHFFWNKREPEASAVDRKAIIDQEGR